MSIEKLESIKKIGEGFLDKSSPTQSVERSDQFQSLMDKGQVDPAKQTENTSANKVGETEKSTPMDQASKTQMQGRVQRIETLNMENLRKQIHETLDQIDKTKTQLENLQEGPHAERDKERGEKGSQQSQNQDEQQRDGKEDKESLSVGEVEQKQIKPAYKHLLYNHLNHIDDSLRIALSKAKSEFSTARPPIAESGSVENKSSNPAKNFLELLTNGEAQLEHLSSMLEQGQINGKELNPANMLAIQIKVGRVQQQLELFTSLLGKALESIKTVMNVQV